MKRLEHLVAPPRHVPVDVYLKSLLGGFLQQFGWLFFSFGLLFVVIFVARGGLVEGVVREWAFRGQTETARGTVLWAEETGASQNEVEVVRFGYEFEAGGQKLEGQCYFTGWRFDEGDTVTVEYLAENPALSRIRGSRWSQFSPWVGLIVMIFPGVGLLLVISAVPNCLRSVKLLKYGRVAHGTLVSKEPTGTRINDQTVYEFTFKFTAESTGREHLARGKTHHTEVLEDEEHEPLLYLPSFPDFALMFDSLPGSPTVNARGQFEGGNPLSALPYLVLPLAGLMEFLYLVQNTLDVLASEGVV